MLSFSLSSSASLSCFVGAFPCVGFSGSRVPGSVGAISCGLFLPSVVGFSGAVGVGCARGVDCLVRLAVPSAVVFRVRPPLSRGSFAARSARLVRWVASSGGLLVAFPSAVAPAGLRPCSSFAGFGSGSWGSVALALGLGCVVLVVVPRSLGLVFPAPLCVASRFVWVGVAPCGGCLWLAR